MASRNLGFIDDDAQPYQQSRQRTEPALVGDLPQSESDRNTRYQRFQQMQRQQQQQQRQQQQQQQQQFQLLQLQQQQQLQLQQQWSDHIELEAKPASALPSPIQPGHGARLSSLQGRQAGIAVPGFTAASVAPAKLALPAWTQEAAKPALAYPKQSRFSFNLKRASQYTYSERDLDDDGFAESGVPDAISAEQYTAAIVPSDDNTETPSFTFRVVLLGTIWAAILAFTNTIFSFRTNSFTVPTIAAALLSYPMGIFLARILPDATVNSCGMRWSFNPGSFTIKEHVLVYIIASSAGTAAYGIDNIVAQKWIYKQEGIDIFPSFAWIFTTQMIGYGIAGILRGILVRPASMMWPTNMSTIALFVSFHNSDPTEPSDDETKKAQFGLSRYWFFWIALSFVIIWEVLPQYLATSLQAVSLLCFFASKDLRLLGAGSAGTGFGVMSISLDWSVITSINEPLTSPFWASANLFFGNVLFLWILSPIAYYRNMFPTPLLGGSNAFTIIDGYNNTNVIGDVNTVSLYDKDGNTIHFSDLLINGVANQTAIDMAKPIYFSVVFGIGYILEFMNITAVFTHIALWHSEEIWQWIRNFITGETQEEDDLHNRIMSSYVDVPDWAYLVFLVAFLALQMLVCHFTPFKLDLYGVILGFALATVCALPFGIIQAITGIQPGLNVISEFIYGLITSDMIQVLSFKSFSYNIIIQALNLTADLKLGHYLHISPIQMVVAQFYGTVIGSIVQTLTTFWMMGPNWTSVLNVKDEWKPIEYITFGSSGIIWGAIGPREYFGNSSIYHPLLYSFILGAVLPVIIWLCNRIWPWPYWRLINIPVITLALPTNGSNQGFILPAFLVAFVSQYYMFNYHRALWAKYNYILSVALDVGTGLASTLTGLLVVWLNESQSHGKLSPETPDYYCLGTYEQVEL